MATLFVVATPIGNLADLSPRAGEVLEQVPVVAAESLERTKKLLSHLGLRNKRLISCREANKKRAVAQILEALGEGRDVALVSDAGTPGLSDPGQEVVEAAALAGHRVSPLPGPSALAAAMSVSGIKQVPLVFLGFLPVKQGQRRRLLERAADTGWSMAVFEAPHRLADTARDIFEVLGQRPVALCRELTKLHEEVVHTTSKELAAGVGADWERGEITLVIGPGQEAKAAPEEVDGLLAQGMDGDGEKPSALARKVAKQTGWNRDEVYQRMLVLKQRKMDQGEMKGKADPRQAPEQGIMCREIEVVNNLGLHARAAAKISELVQGYDCRITLTKGEVEADAASVLAILGLDAPKGSLVKALADGPQAHDALKALEVLFADFFGEGS